MVSVAGRAIPTVLTVEELLDKAFSKAKKAGDAVVDKDRVYRTRKQMTRMVGSAGDSLSSTLLDWVRRWPSLDKMSSFDVAMVEAAVGCDGYRQSLGACQWAADKCVKRQTGNRGLPIYNTATACGTFCQPAHEIPTRGYPRSPRPSNGGTQPN